MFALNQHTKTSIHMKLSTILTLSFCLLASCGPRMLTPLGTESHMERPYATLEIDSITVNVENVVMRGDHLLFDVEIENHTQQCQPYSSQAMYFQGFTKKGNLKTLTPTSYQQKYYSPTPVQWNTFAYNEGRAKRFMKQKVSSQKAGKTFLDLLSLGLLVNEVVQESKDANQSFWTEDDARRADNRAAANFAAQLALTASSSIMAESIASNSWEREDVEDNYLGAGEIDPGDQVRGLVLFPKAISAKRYTIFIPVGERLFEFSFEKPQTP